MIKPVIWSAQFHLIFHENLTLSICQVQTKNPSQCVYSEFLTHSIIAGAHLSVCRAPFPLLLFQESWWWGLAQKKGNQNKQLVEIGSVLCFYADVTNSHTTTPLAHSLMISDIFSDGLISPTVFFHLLPRKKRCPWVFSQPGLLPFVATVDSSAR